MIIPAKKLAAFVATHAKSPAIIEGSFGGPLGSTVQDKEWSCGAAAIKNVCAELKLDIDEQEIMELADTDAEGTDEDGMLNALHTIGLKTEVLHTDDPVEAWETLIMYVASGFPCILCVDKWDHWVAATGTDGDKVLIQDSELTRKNVEVNGVHYYSELDLMPRWEYTGDEKAFYAIACSRP